MSLVESVGKLHRRLFGQLFKCVVVSWRGQLIDDFHHIGTDRHALNAWVVPPSPLCVRCQKVFVTLYLLGTSYLRMLTPLRCSRRRRRR